MSDPIAHMLADALAARDAPPAETALQMAARMGRELRTAALDRALTALRGGMEARQTDIDLFGTDPTMHLSYLDARDEALALHGGALAWDHRPGDPSEGDEE